MRLPRKKCVWYRSEVKTPPISEAARAEIGRLLRRVQRGLEVTMPHSRPLLEIGPHCHELRVNEAAATWRVIGLRAGECRRRNNPVELGHGGFVARSYDEGNQNTSSIAAWFGRVIINRGGLVCAAGFAVSGQVAAVWSENSISYNPVLASM